LPMMLPPVLLFSTYINLQNFSASAGGISAACSGLYLLLAQRRRQGISGKITARGFVRGVAMGVCMANAVGGGVAYAFGKRSLE
jgi:hypothetical protein